MTCSPVAFAISIGICKTNCHRQTVIILIKNLSSPFAPPTPRPFPCFVPALARRDWKHQQRGTRRTSAAVQSATRPGLWAQPGRCSALQLCYPLRPSSAPKPERLAVMPTKNGNGRRVGQGATFPQPRARDHSKWLTPGGARPTVKMFKWRSPFEHPPPPPCPVHYNRRRVSLGERCLVTAAHAAN